MGVTGLVIAKYDSTKNENEGVEVKYNHDDGKQVASLKNYLRKNSAAYKSARPDEKVEADDFKEEAADEGKEGEDGGEGDMAEEMKNMTPEEKAKMEKEMGEMAETNE